jgi:hypothetical protein
MPKMKKQNNLGKKHLNNRKTRVPKEPIRKNGGRLKETESSNRSGLKHITNASPVCNPCDDQSRGEKLSLISKNTNKRGKVTSVPVVSSTGKPLMPCSPARAKELMKKGRAIKRFTNRIFYIKLIEREDGEVQKIACGIDSGSMREGFTVKSGNKTFINILSETNNTIKKKMENRSAARKHRRYINTPCRKCRYNRNVNQKFIPPSTRARWNAKLRIINILRKIYPISDYVVEDIKAVTKKGNINWNKSFSPLESGKNYFYDEIIKIGKLTLMQGYETATIRKELGLVKTKQKLVDVFSAHNVDSWVLANSLFNIQKIPDNTLIIKFIPILIIRRQLFKFKVLKNGKKTRYGGTVSLGIPKGTVCKYKNTYIKVGGYKNDKLTIHNLFTNERISREIKKNNLHNLNYVIKWNVVYVC